MSSVEKVLVMLVAGGMLYTLVAPGNKTPQVIEKFWGGFTGALKASTGR